MSEINNTKTNNIKNNSIFNIYKKNLFDIGIKTQEELKTPQYKAFISSNPNNNNIPHINPKPFVPFNKSTLDERLNNPASVGPLSQEMKQSQLEQFYLQNHQRQQTKTILEEDIKGLFNIY